MRDYSVVSPQFWIGGTGKELRGDMSAQLLALYLMSSPHANMTGIFHCPILYMAHETGMDMEGASEALARLIERGFCAYESDSETVFVVRMAAYQIGESLQENDKRVAGLRKEMRKLPDSYIKQRFMEVYGEAYHLLDGHEEPSPSQGPHKPLRSQEQEQEQEQNNKSGDKQNGKYPSAFETAWAKYPKRHGGNSKAEAFKAWRARTNNGVEPETMQAGVERYASYASATGKAGTEFVKQAATFFGPNEHYLEPWEMPAQQPTEDVWAGTI